MKSLLIGALALGLTSAAASACPVGSYQWVDRWGNEICKRFGDGSTASIQGSLDDCPVGTHPGVDSWGNQVCKSFGGRAQYYDTSDGCPTGTFEWVDSWGNPICRRF